GLDAGDRLDAPVGEGRDQPLDAGAQAVGMTEQRGDVTEHNAGLRIVGYRAHEVLEIDVFGQAHTRISVMLASGAASFSAYSGTMRGWLAPTAEQEGRIPRPTKWAIWSPSAI